MSGAPTSIPVGAFPFKAAEERATDERFTKEKASSPFLRADYQRAAEEYQSRARAELRLMEREGASTTAS
jgi:hypothetical protein